MNKYKNIKTLVIALVLLVGIVGVGSTVALITSSKSIVNTFKAIEKVDTKLEENVDPKEVAVNTDILKQPYVENVSGGAAFIRARITVSPSDLDVTLKTGTWTVGGNTLDATNPGSLSGEKTFAESGTVYSKTDGFRNVAGTGWVYYNGWYYYNVVTAPNSEYQYTSTLFDAVILGDGVKADDAIDITVYQEAVSASGYAAGAVVSDVKEIAARFN